VLGCSRSDGFNAVKKDYSFAASQLPSHRSVDISDCLCTVQLLSSTNVEIMIHYLIYHKNFFKDYTYF